MWSLRTLPHSMTCHIDISSLMRCSWKLDCDKSDDDSMATHETGPVSDPPIADLRFNHMNHIFNYIILDIKELVPLRYGE